MTRKRVLLLVTAVGALGLAGYALAIPPVPGPPHRGTLVHRIKAHSDGVHLHTHGSTDVIAQDVSYPPGANSGWHYHPGVVVLEVEGPPGGFLTFHEGCDTFTIPSDHGFHETGHEPGLLENTSSSTMTVHAMFILPTGAPPRVNTDPPPC